jgi:hypothetical protein
VVSGESFCNREKEAADLRRSVENTEIEPGALKTSGFAYNKSGY